ncbi:HAMP domain-containing sensor histidine kinase [Fictibacillus enclensis]|uniref:histidine kinase dimerization/phospho-acceptor domain-containing protein n=1 Tax=Fictibacillus enclensis TaxID=1017270 RepID=UPI0025A1CE7A|nr:HAMP domain-containing sensor histidine kinase [Fictibacillus enclensis]MDM5201501.1 HAMP domain-containing sensor histidine kinase [Fictibacillus enclensis]
MLHQLRRKLTWNYSSWFFITLFIIFVLLYFLVKGMMFETAREDIQDILHYELNKDKASDLNEDSVTQDPGSLYYSVVVKNGSGDSTGKTNQAFNRFVQSKSCCSREGKLAELKAKNGHEKQHIIYASARLNETTVLYVGKNISGVHEKVERWFFLLSLLGLAVFILSVVMGERLSRKALKPVIQNMESQKKFIADASHELRTPISIFSASLEVLEKEEKSKMSSFSQETLNELKEEVHQMKNLVSHLLTLAKDQERQEIHQDSFSINELARNMASQYERLSQSTRTVKVIAPPEDLIVEADRVRIKELLQLLLDNALKYSDAGSQVEIRLKAQARIIW